MSKNFAVNIFVEHGMDEISGLVDVSNCVHAKTQYILLFRYATELIKVSTRNTCDIKMWRNLYYKVI